MASVSAMEVDDEIDELIIASCYINAISATAVLNYYVRAAAMKRSRRYHRLWVSKYLALRPKFGVYSSLIPDLMEVDNTRFRNYIRMDVEDFEELFRRVEPYITRTNTRFRYVASLRPVTSVYWFRGYFSVQSNQNVKSQRQILQSKLEECAVQKQAISTCGGPKLVQ
jgi:hypothetical protein